ncbi:AAA family ATPase [Nitrosophilus kaiyonis]|uniref:AAA family ATPase n=1 Tax=Nitrosophilus kaiyonis TaxID=2930200 RepID=UPI0024938EA5|nr:AAA family ATPase [Nitrosophilus kaiyonis]
MPKLNLNKGKYNFLKELETAVQKLLQNKQRVLIAISGKSGVGKSTLGKFIRKNGFGKYKPKEIAVIDDSVMTKEYFGGLIKRKIKIKYTNKDNLYPFIKLIPRKKIIFYISANPFFRIEKCDILIKLTLNEKERIKRLKLRNGIIKNKNLEFLNTENYKFDYYIEASVD